MIKIKNLILKTLLLFGICITNVKGGDITSVVVGQSAPDFEMKNLLNYSMTSAKLSDFKGKAVILDFWATWCSPCVASLPKMDTLQKNYGSKLQIILINNEDGERVKEFFTKMEKVHRIDLMGEVANGQIFEQYGIKILPHYVWISKDGVVKAISKADQVTAENIETLISDGPLHLKTEDTLPSAKYTADLKPLSGLDDGPQQLQYQSVITKYQDGQHSFFQIPTKPNLTYTGRRILAKNLPPMMLYRIAYGGEKFPTGFPSNQVRIEVADSLQFIESTNRFGDTSLLYCYDLIVPGFMKTDLYVIMKQDLERYFPIRGQIKKQRVNCLVLTAPDSSKLPVGGGKPLIDKNYYWLKMTNQPFKKLSATLGYYLQSKGMPFKDETGITRDINIDISAKLTDMDSVLSEIRKYGLDLAIAEREIEVLILSESDKPEVVSCQNTSDNKLLVAHFFETNQ